MELRCEVEEGWAGFYPMLMEDEICIVSEYAIAEFLELKFKEYAELMIQSSGSKNDYYHYFITDKECREFIDKIIEPRLVMKELTR